MQIISFDEWMHVVRLKFYGWLDKNRIRKGTQVYLEKILNEYTTLNIKLKNFRNELYSMDTSRSFSIDIYKNMKEIGIGSVSPRLGKIDKEINKLNKTMKKIDEMIFVIYQEVGSRNLEVSKTMDGRFYLVERDHFRS